MAEVDRTMVIPESARSVEFGDGRVAFCCAQSEDDTFVVLVMRETQRSREVGASAEDVFPMGTKVEYGDEDVVLVFNNPDSLKLVADDLAAAHSRWVGRDDT